MMLLEVKLKTSQDTEYYVSLGLTKEDFCKRESMMSILEQAYNGLYITLDSRIDLRSIIAEKIASGEIPLDYKETQHAIAEEHEKQIKALL